MHQPERFIPYGKQSISDSDINAVIEVLQSPFLTQGPAVPAFEQAVAAKVGANYGVAVNSATSALHLACLALGLGPGDTLWTSPTTFVASANCGLYCGANVDFVDIEQETGLMSVEALRQKLEIAEKKNKLPKVVVPVHLCGTSCDMEAIADLADQYGFYVVEDASHAIGGSYKGKKVGCCAYSSITVFSFHPVKIITTGEGGLATTNDPELGQRLKRLRSHGITKDEREFETSTPGPWYYEQQDLGFNYRMTDIQAALGISQLKKLDAVVEERNRQFDAYREHISELPVKLLTIPKGVRSSIHLAVIYCRNHDPEQHRRIFEGLREYRIGVQLHYIPVHLHPHYRRIGFKEGDFPQAERYANSAISLPLYPGLSSEDQLRVVTALSKLLTTNSGS